ncbi:MAG TPA: zinc-ribbon domain containing protein [Anaerolineae bacterium]|nr:zinc-ribbon domain containing protein [Anaerolineae bacterium]HPL29157.1 zinc-ribbon domain containing protein [Anaerolineae bacterium]
MAFQDKTLVCRDCGAQFIFTAGEQEFYQQKGFEHEPSRCPECRGKKRGLDRRPAEDRQMFPAICSDCGQETMVPFEPRSDKPVYCQACFAKHRRR